jgi:subtilase family serine protease
VAVRLRIVWLCSMLTFALVAASAFADSPAPAPAGVASRAVCPTAPAGGIRCDALVVTDSAGRALATSSPSGYGPQQFHGAYDLPLDAASPKTIAIVDAFDSTTIEGDLGVYDTAFALPPCTIANGCFTKVNQRGQPGPYPRIDNNWAPEIALDVETAHATCQNCRILLVEADSAHFRDIAVAENTAVALGASVISNSFGETERPGARARAAFDHPGVAIVASTGDAGFGVQFPADSPFVVAVGGTSLQVTNDAQGGYGYGGETAWSGGGSGCSGDFNAQPWQLHDPSWSLTGCGSQRAMVDVAADADPATGAAVYNSCCGFVGWLKVGGTSVAAPLIAGVFGLADSANAFPGSLPYKNRTGLHDVTSGSNGSCGTIMCEAAVGYDGPTGLGSPDGLAGFTATGSG